VVVDGNLYAVGGRRSSASTKQVFELTIPQVDVFDLHENQWSTLPPEANFPVPRAGCFSIPVGAQFLVAGGESSLQRDAHRQVHAFDTQSKRWRLLSRLNQGRHGTGIVQWNNTLYTVAGSGRRGGRPELDSTEVFRLAVSGETGEN
jgi:N-acetylneuraminic acid mutarotase